MPAWLEWVSAFPVELATVIIAALPLVELRLAIPLALTVFGLPPVPALAYAIIGNAVPMFVILFWLPPFVRLAERRWPWLHRVLEHYFRRLEQKHRTRYQRWGAVALAVFVAIPIPGTGVWTASVLAVLFQMDRRHAMAGLLAGILGAAAIVFALTLGIENILTAFA